LIGERFVSCNHFCLNAMKQYLNGSRQIIEGAGGQCTAWPVAGAFFVASYQPPNQVHPMMGALSPARYSVRIHPAADTAVIPTINDDEADEDNRAPLGIPREGSRRAWEVANGTPVSR
jgi:hypothetical protein